MSAVPAMADPASGAPGRSPSDLLTRHDLVQQIQTAGLRITIQRLAVLRVVTDLRPAGSEISVADLMKRLLQHGDDVPLGACYRILSSLERASLVNRRLDEKFGRAVSFYSIASDRSSHWQGVFRCQQCHGDTPLADASLSAHLAQLAVNAGLRLAAQEIVIPVVCAACDAEA